jgi:hypothetical protein
MAGVSPRYPSHVNKGRKNLGDEVCRKFEVAHKLTFGWMDTSHDKSGVDGGVTGEESDFIALALKLYRNTPIEVQALLMRFMAERM